jgi:phosphate transport system ATP-binding protein
MLESNSYMQRKIINPHPLTQHEHNFFEVKDLSVSLHGKKIIDEVSLSAPRGSITAIVGPSGVGKSTFLKVFNRILETESPVQISGTVEIENLSIYNKKVDLQALRRKVGMVFQRPTPFPVSIFKNISIPLSELNRFSTIELRIAVEKYLALVGLWDEVKDKLHHSALSLSGGQQQRLCIARAMSLNPSIMLFDEPCSSLDPRSTATIEELLGQLRSQTTMLIVTHNLAQARRVSDQTGLFWPINSVGKLVEWSPTTDFFEDPKSAYTKSYVFGHSG